MVLCICVSHRHQYYLVPLSLASILRNDYTRNLRTIHMFLLTRLLECVRGFGSKLRPFEFILSDEKKNKLFSSAEQTKPGNRRKRMTAPLRAV